MASGPTAKANTVIRGPGTCAIGLTNEKNTLWTIAKDNIPKLPRAEKSKRKEQYISHFLSSFQDKYPCGNSGILSHLLFACRESIVLGFHGSVTVTQGARFLGPARPLSSVKSMKSQGVTQTTSLYEKLIMTLQVYLPLKNVF